ncbi:hypothetical protein [Haloferax sulfurifontis]|uniref:Uncharacterized protein n=1 Tax=Haloferax sulfurifontis TaxID=255616 RepID=A0A830E9N5_9EURY|nr:hypothetical protein [Haloferax sulfurifontis]GGC55948.1 hypothetical protein GCM10007209_17220 [Haloferax sulfurifontis]
MRVTSRLEEYFEGRTDGNLRSIVKYNEDSHDVVYLRDDVADGYTEDEVKKSVDASRMDSLTAPIYTDTFSKDHGELTCLVQCFKNVIEMNFVLKDGVGAAIAIDAEAFSENQGLVAGAREIVIEERE